MRAVYKKINAVLNLSLFLLCAGFLLFLFFDEQIFSLIEPKSFKAMWIWQKNPSLVIPRDNLFSLFYYLFFSLSFDLFETVSGFIRTTHILFCGFSFVFYLLWCRIQFKQMYLLLFASVFYICGYFLYPGNVFWFFFLNALLVVLFPKGIVIFLPCLVFSSFGIGSLFGIACLLYLFSLKNSYSFFLKVFSLLTFVLSMAFVVGIDGFFYASFALAMLDKEILLWQIILFCLLFAIPLFLAKWYAKVSVKRLVFLIIFFMVSVVGLKFFRPFEPLDIENQSVLGVKQLLAENDLSDDDLILLDDSSQSVSFFIASGLSCDKFIFADRATANAELFKKYLKHSVVGYVIARDTGEMPFGGTFFDPEGDWDIRTDNLIYESMYGDTVYSVWKFNQDASGDLDEGIEIFADYKYLPSNMILGAERMRKKVNANATDFMALTSLGRIYCEMLDFPKAKKWLFKALAVNDNYSDTYLHLAFTYTLEYSLSKHKPFYLYFLAKQLYLRGLCFEGANHEYYHLLGDLEEARGDLKEAVVYSQKALSLSNNTCDPSHYRMALWELQHDNKEKAKDHLQKAINNASIHSGDTAEKYKLLLSEID